MVELIYTVSIPSISVSTAEMFWQVCEGKIREVNNYGEYFFHHREKPIYLMAQYKLFMAHGVRGGGISDCITGINELQTCAIRPILYLLE